MSQAQQGPATEWGHSIRREVAWRVVEWLRSQGHDAVHLDELGLRRMADSDIFRKAQAEDRGILTFELDFGDIVAFSRDKRVSGVLFRLLNARTARVIERLSAALTDSADALDAGAVVVVEDTKCRTRRLLLADNNGSPLLTSVEV